MQSKFLTRSATVLLLAASGVAVSTVQAQTNPTAGQLEADANKKIPAAADAALARDEATSAKRNASTAKRLAKEPRAKAAAAKAMKQASVASSEAAAATKETASGKGMMRKPK